MACGGACGRPAPGRLRHTLASDLSLGSFGRPSRPPRLLLRCLPHLPLRPREGDQPVACAWSDPLPLPQPSATNAHDPASPDPPLCRAYVRTYVQDRDRNRERERERKREAEGERQRESVCVCVIVGTRQLCQLCQPGGVRIVLGGRWGPRARSCRGLVRLSV